MNAVQDLARTRKTAIAIAASGYAPVRPDAPMPEPAAPKPLPDELLPLEAFPLAALPEAFRPWVADVSQRMNCPPDFVAVPLIVGRPGIMKSPAMAQALAPMDRLKRTRGAFSPGMQGCSAGAGPLMKPRRWPIG